MKSQTRDLDELFKMANKEGEALVEAYQSGLRQVRLKDLPALIASEPDLVVIVHSVKG